MKRITFRVEDDLIQKARLIARSQHKTLNAVFREWLIEFTAHSNSTREFDSLMKRLRHVKAGRSFRREEMNQR